MTPPLLQPPLLKTELINRSGFRYTEYYAVGNDGYITQVIRVINPKADPKQLKQPPVLMLHGSHLDTSIYVVSSSIQHHPEPWPRKPADGPMTSWNRSLAFTLANNGFDVWLIGGRGSNSHNSGWTPKAKYHQSLMPNFKPTHLMKMISYLPKYWDYDLDDIIKNEIPIQIDLIRNITKSREFHYFSYSLSTATTMAFLGENPSYAKDVRTYTQLAPVIAATHFTHAGRFYWEKLAPFLPNRGIGFGPSYFWDDFFVKRAVFIASHWDHLRFGLLHEWNRSLFGPSPIYQTFLEKNVLYHIIQPVSFKSAQQYAQASRFGKLRYYDYGPIRNLIKYNSTIPPEHKVDKLEVQNYLIISGSLDCLADPVTVQRIKELTITPSPVTHILAPGFNHIDLIAAVENDIYVNKPYVEYLDKHSDMPKVMPTPDKLKATTTAEVTSGSTTGLEAKMTTGTTTHTKGVQTSPNARKVQ